MLIRMIQLKDLDLLKSLTLKVKSKKKEKYLPTYLVQPIYYLLSPTYPLKY